MSDEGYEDVLKAITELVSVTKTQKPSRDEIKPSEKEEEKASDEKLSLEEAAIASKIENFEKSENVFWDFTLKARRTTFIWTDSWNKEFLPFKIVLFAPFRSCQP